MIGILRANPIITLFLKPYTTIANTENSQKIADKLKKPGKIAKMHLKSVNRTPWIKGILATYAGYVAISNNDGQISFPKKHILPIVYLVITNNIAPILITGNTIHHWEIINQKMAKMYKIERLHNNSEELFYWQVTEVPLPENNRIPLESITILAKPDRIYVPEGTSLTDDNTNLVLPSIFIKKGINSNSHALYMLNVRQFFDHSSPMLKKGTHRYLTLTQ